MSRTSTVSKMREHATRVEWHYVVPDKNTTRVVISQRKDGPFRNDATGGAGHYHVSVEDLDPKTSRWEHRPGTSSGAHDNFMIALHVAGDRWAEEVERHG